MVISYFRGLESFINKRKNEDSTSIDMAGSKEKTMMRNTTMKMSVNPQESMDKFLQRLEKSVIDFIASGNTNFITLSDNTCQLFVII